MDENWNGKKGKQKDTERQNKANRKDRRTSKNTYIHEKKSTEQKKKNKEIEIKEYNVYARKVKIRTVKK